MQLRALIKTRKRKWAMIALSVVVCAVVVWAIFALASNPSDEAKLRSVERDRNWGDRVYQFRVRHRLPGPLADGLKKLERRFYDNAYKQEQELVAAGFLVSLPLMAWPGTYAPVRTNTAKLSSEVGTNIYLRFYLRSDVVVAICRSNEAPRIRAALENRP